MAKDFVDEGFEESYYFHWKIYSNGSMWISNGSSNSVLKQYLFEDKYFWNFERIYYN